MGDVSVKQGGGGGSAAGGAVFVRGGGVGRRGVPLDVSYYDSNCVTNAIDGGGGNENF